MSPTIREANEGDVAGIREVFLEVYGDEYPYQGFLDPTWLKRSVFGDDIFMLVACEGKEVLGTASVVFDVGAHSDLSCEFGRLAVRPSARGEGLGNQLMAERVRYCENRVHVGIVENRAVHSYSQKISHAHGFAPVGFLPLKHQFQARESIAMFARPFGRALELRCNHPRIVPEAHALAHLALSNLELPWDCIIDEQSAPYPYPDEDYALTDLSDEGLPSLLRIERGRIKNREVFGPMRLQYGFFKLTARHATYLVAHEPSPGPGSGPIAGAIGYIRDDIDHVVRVFELIARDDRATRFLFGRLVERCSSEWGIAYVEVDVSAHAPRLQRTLLELGFLPAAYVPAFAFHHVERLDVIKMVRLLVEPDVGEVALTPSAQQIADVVMRGFSRQAVLPEIARTVNLLAPFQGLNEEQVSRVAGACTLGRFSDGERLFDRGEEADRVHLLLEGLVSVQRGERCVGEVSAGEALGEIALLTGEPHSCRATAKGPVVAAQLLRDDLAQLVRQRPDIAVAVYRNLAEGLGRKLIQLNASLADKPLEVS